MKTLLKTRFLWLILVLGTFAVATWTCKYPTGPVNPNTAPHTRLANVPANDTIARFIERNAFPELQLNWVGDDPDGYVIGFQYRWTTTREGEPFPPPGAWSTLLNITKSDWQNVIVVKGIPSSYFNVYNFLATLGPNDTSLIRIIGDSLATNRTFAVPYKTGIIPTDSVAGAPLLVLQTPTIGTFIFDSPADSNFHRFEIRSVDNSGAADPFPATIYFWTLESPGSVVTFDSWSTGNPLAMKYKTDRWLGLHFVYHALDANNSFGFQFQWAVDDTITWSPWTDSQEAYVTAADFKPYQTGTAQHVFHVRAKNRWGVISPDSIRNFTATVPRIDDPSWPKRTLIINDCLIWNAGNGGGSGTRGRPSLGQIDTLYRGVMDSLGKTGRFDIWRIGETVPQFRWPSRDTLGYYSSVLIVLPVGLPNIGADARYRFPSAAQTDFRDYLNTGGKLIWDGSPNMQTAIQNFNTFNTFAGTWATDIFHIVPNTAQSPFIISQGLDFNGVWGVEGYPDVRLDTNKIAPDSATAMRNIGNIAINFPNGFAQTISQFHSRYGTFYENLPVGVRFLAPPPLPPARQTFSVVFFGFPLYYAENSAIVQSMRKAFQDINE